MTARLFELPATWREDRPVPDGFAWWDVSASLEVNPHKTDLFAAADDDYQAAERRLTAEIRRPGLDAVRLTVTWWDANDVPSDQFDVTAAVAARTEDEARQALATVLADAVEQCAVHVDEEARP